MYNAYRKKGKSFQALWTVRTPVDKEQAAADMAFIKKIEEKETGWVDQIYRNAGIRRPVADKH